MSGAAPESSTLVEAARCLLSAAQERGLTLAVAESLTGGGVVSALVGVPGASAVVVGGVVAYATRIKSQLLGVDRGRLERTGPVDGEVAEQMARGVARLMGADLGLATTGVAGPGGDGEAFPWRFWLDGEPTVSPYRPAVTRRRPQD